MERLKRTCNKRNKTDDCRKSGKENRAEHFFYSRPYNFGMKFLCHRLIVFLKGDIVMGQYVNSVGRTDGNQCNRNNA